MKCPFCNKFNDRVIEEFYKKNYKCGELRYCKSCDRIYEVKYLEPNAISEFTTYVNADSIVNAVSDVICSKNFDDDSMILSVIRVDQESIEIICDYDECRLGVKCDKKLTLREVVKELGETLRAGWIRSFCVNPPSV